MINSVGQYEYVIGADVDEAHPHGDLDRIVIDGEVMPLRTGDTGKTDKDGNAISRQKILRGEDIAFLLEAFYQRYYCNWCAEVVGWSWETSTATGTTEKKFMTQANDKFVQGTFSHKVSRSQLNRMRNILDSVCNSSVNGLDCGTNVSEVSQDFRTAYGFTGLSESLRIYLNYPVPTDGLGTVDDIMVYFGVLGYYLPCAVLDCFTPYAVHTSLSKYDTDGVVEGEHPFASTIGDAAGWWTNAARVRPMDGTGAQTGPDETGVLYVFPKSDFEFFRIRAPHVAELRIALKLAVTTYRDVPGSTEGLTATRYVWMPFTATKDGEWFSLTAGECGFSTKDSLASICQTAGLEVTSVPSEDQLDMGSAVNTAQVKFSGFQFLGRWDDHTKWR